MAEPNALPLILLAEQFAKLPGIGMKTARCFIIHSRENASYSGLDTHMLKHLTSLGYNVPKSTPSRKLYLTLEQIVIKLAAERKMTPAEYDLLSFLIKKNNCVVSRAELLGNALSLDDENESRSLDVLMSRIRTKLGESSKEPRLIHSVRGIGYRLQA